MAPILDACDLVVGQSILDVGCATGDLVAMAVGRGYEAYGVDLNASAVAKARGERPLAHTSPPARSTRNRSRAGCSMPSSWSTSSSTSVTRPARSAWPPPAGARWPPRAVDAA